MGALFYGLNRHHFSDVPLSRWIQIALLLVAAVALANWSLGGWMLAALAFVAFGAFTAASIRWRRRGYVRFEQSEMPSVVPASLAPKEKIPVFASGFFGVEGKHAQFTWIQGYFRTFATREHALLCLVQPSRFAWLGSWPEKELGMWYIFFKDSEVEQVRWGTIRHGDHALTGLAVSLRIFIPAQGRFSRDRTLHKTAYIACPDAEDARRILADLLHEPSMEVQSKPSQNGAGALPVNEQKWRRIDG